MRPPHSLVVSDINRDSHGPDVRTGKRDIDAFVPRVFLDFYGDVDRHAIATLHVLASSLPAAGNWAASRAADVSGLDSDSGSANSLSGSGRAGDRPDLS